MTLRARLVLALLAVALFPIALYTVFTLKQLDYSARRWVQPGVNHALEAALETTRSDLARLESVALSFSEAWAARWPDGPLTDRGREALQAALRESGLDFVQFYRLEDGRWVRVEHVMPSRRMPAGELDLGSDLPADLTHGHVVHSGQGALAAASPVGANGAVVAGLWVAPNYFENLSTVGEGVNRYRQLGVLVPLQRRYVWLLVSVLVILLGILSVLLATLLARQMSKPLRDLSVALERVAAGDLAVRVTSAGAREFRMLDDAFNQMAGSLETARTSLRQAEREAAWREVARHLAHEIKNPLTPMRLSLHRVQRRLDSVPEPERAAMRESLEALVQEIEHLTRLAEQFAQYARLPEPRFEPVDLAEIARRVAQLHEPEMMQWRGEGAARLPVHGDALMLSRALHNLTLNAREASPDGAQIEIVTRAENGLAVVEVLDRGPGLAAEVRERAFEPYVSTKGRGSGLGLPLVRDVASRHGGRVTLENRDGGGACARLELPLLKGDGVSAANE